MVSKGGGVSEIVKYNSVYRKGKGGKLQKARGQEEEAVMTAEDKRRDAWEWCVG